MTQKTKIAVIGDHDSIMIFKALGFKTIASQNKEIIEKKIEELAEAHYSVIYITEKEALLVGDTIDKYKTEPFPAIIPIPGKGGSNGFGMKGVRVNVEKAVGADIL